MIPEEHQRIAQAAEAEMRRSKIAERFNISEEESKLYGLKFQEALSSLTEDPTLKDVAEQYDAVILNSPRDKEIKQAFVDSAIGKVSESIRYFLSSTASEELQGLLTEISDQLEGNQVKFESFQDIQKELTKYQSIFKKYGIEEVDVMRAYIDEAKAYRLEELWKT